MRILPMSKVAGVVAASILAALLFLAPAPDAKACRLCAGRDCSVFCQYVSVGWTECVASTCDCLQTGNQCAIGLTKLEGEGSAATCSKTALDSSSMSGMIPYKNSLNIQPEYYLANGVSVKARGTVEPSWKNGANAIAGPSAAEIEQLEKLKDRTKNRVDYRKGLEAGRIDYIALVQGEARDERWAPVAELSISKELATLPLEEYGLSRPAVQCTTNVCEIMVVQKYSGTENLSTNWQTLFVIMTKSNALGLDVADSMTLMTNLDSEKSGFVTYLLVDRGQPI